MKINDIIDHKGEILQLGTIVFEEGSYNFCCPYTQKYANCAECALSTISSNLENPRKPWTLYLFCGCIPVCYEVTFKDCGCSTMTMIG